MKLIRARLNRLVGNLIQKDWNDELVQKYVGNYQQCYFTYATDPSFRKQAASGGSVTALLSYLLASGQIDGALVCRTFINENGKIRPEFFIAKNVEELMSSQGSKYMAVFFSAQAFPLIRNFAGRLAVVGLPCDITILQRARKNTPLVSEKVVLAISLLCGHNSEPILTDRIVDRLRPNGQRLLSYRYRLGHWRGYLQAEYSNQEQPVIKPFSYFSDYQNLYFFSQRKCHHCSDHTGYNADISAGDIWSLRMQQEPIKHTALITRNDFASQVVNEALEKGILTGRPEPISEVCEGQARTMPFHYNVSARAKAGRLLGEKIKDTVGEKVKTRDYVVAWLTLSNEKISRTKTGQKILFSIPRPIIKLYLYFIKLLESI